MLHDFPSAVWLMEPGRLRVLGDRLARVTDLPTPAQMEAFREASAAQLRRVSGKVAVLNITGLLEPRLTEASWMYGGGTSTEAIGSTVDMLAANKEVAAIVLRIDSPGGVSYLIEETADKIYAARQAKPVIAVADPMSASASFWLAAAASQVIATPSADVGSVGVFTMHADISKALENDGVTVTVVRAGRFKAENSPFAPLTPEALANLQLAVDETYDKFVKALAKFRGVPASAVRSGYGEGRVMSADRALAAGMIDKVMPFDEAMSRLTGGPGGSSGGARSAEDETPAVVVEERRHGAEILRLRHDQRRRLAGAFVPARRAGPGLTHDSKVADNEPSWDSVDKTRLPRVAFADKGEPDAKTTWHFPHHWAENGGGLDDSGVYTTGTLWLHREGLNAAWSAAMGGRSGQKASQEVIDHLMTHRRALGMEND